MYVGLLVSMYGVNLWGICVSLSIDMVFVMYQCEEF